MNLKEGSKEDKIIVITGCTASGKTELIKKIFQYYPIEVISCDSRQIYKFMDIGTAKPDKETSREIKHHLIDIKLPDEYFSTFEFYENVIKLNEVIRKNGKIPIIVGGTILYLLTLKNGIFKLPKIPENIRKEINKELKEYGLEKLYRELTIKDPERAIKLNPNDKQRITRSLEIIKGTGIKHSEWLEKEHYIGLNLEIFYLWVDKEELSKRIEKRTNSMVEKGFKEEVIRLLEMGYNKNDYGLTSVGYKEMIEHINGEYSLDETIRIIIKKTKEYAKRQRTFIKKLNPCSKITLDNFELLCKVLDYEKKD